MNLRDHPLVVALGLFFGAMAAVAALSGMVYNAGYDAGYNVAEQRIGELETKIDTLELSDALKLPALLESLRMASGELSTQLLTFRRIAVLSEENQRLTTELNQARSDAAQCSQYGDALQAQLDEKDALLKQLYLEQQTFVLKRATSKSFAGYNLVLGLKLVGPYDATVAFDNRESTLAVGGVVSVTQSGKNYRIILDAVDYKNDSASFTFVVKQ